MAHVTATGSRFLASFDYFSSQLPVMLARRGAVHAVA